MENSGSSKKAVVITGGGSGIGRATARLFSGFGHSVALVGRRREKLDETASLLKGPVAVLPCDVSREQEVHWMLGEAEKELGPLGFLINNAGLFMRGKIDEMPDENWKRLFEVNFMGAVHTTRHIIPFFKKEGHGSIVNVSSTLGIRPIPGTAAYSSLKAALQNFSECMAKELAPLNIRVNTVAFGIVDTPILGLEKLPAPEAEKRRQEMINAHPLKRMGTPENAAQAIYYFCGPHSAWTTGATLTVDGGINLV